MALLSLKRKTEEEETRLIFVFFCFLVMENVLLVSFFLSFFLW